MQSCTRSEHGPRALWIAMKRAPRSVCSARLNPARQKLTLADSIARTLSPAHMY